MLETETAEIELAEILGESLCVTWTSGKQVCYPAIWLRHNCVCQACCDTVSGQKYLDIADLHPELRIEAIERVSAGDVVVCFSPDGHVGRYTAWQLLRARMSAASRDSPLAPELRIWGAEIAEQRPLYDWPRLKTDIAERLNWINDIRMLGFAMVRGLPTTPGMLEEVVALFGRIRENRAGRLFDVSVSAKPTNLAFTSTSLPPHTDNPYRNPGPGLQLLHCLQATSTGGESVVVDGFHGLALLRREDQEAYDLLCKVPVRYANHTGDHWFETEEPAVRIDHAGKLLQLRVNARSWCGPVGEPDVVVRYYAAWRAFIAILDRPELRFSFRLGPGDMFVVNNHRVLHGRSSFDVASPRLLQGCYSDFDWIDGYYLKATRSGPVQLIRT